MRIFSYCSLIIIFIASVAQASDCKNESDVMEALGRFTAVANGYCLEVGVNEGTEAQMDCLKEKSNIFREAQRVGRIKVQENMRKEAQEKFGKMCDVYAEGTALFSKRHRALKAKEKSESQAVKDELDKKIAQGQRESAEAERAMADAVKSTQDNLALHQTILEGNNLNSGLLGQLFHYDPNAECMKKQPEYDQWQDASLASPSGSNLNKQIAQNKKIQGLLEKIG